MAVTFLHVRCSLIVDGIGLCAMVQLDGAEHAGDVDSAAALSSPHSAHASGRWASAILKVVDAPVDPRTIHAWSRLVAASPSVIRAWCLLARVRPKTSLDFARLLRLVVRDEIGRAEECLEVGDPRTIRRLLHMGGIPVRTSRRHSLTIEDFLTRQRLIQSEACLRALRLALHDGSLEHRTRAAPK